MRRRTVLAAGATTVAAALAGCTGTDSDGTTTTTMLTDDDTGGDSAYGGGGGGGSGETETTTATETESTTTTSTTTEAAGGAGDAAVVTVGADGQTRFTPETVTVAPGETVRWEWASGGHNVRPSTQPADADWEGAPGGDSETDDSGYRYEFTFSVSGRYEYYCAPHRSFGMVGSVVVEE